MTVKLPPGVVLKGVAQDAPLADSDWLSNAEVPPMRDSDYVTKQYGYTISDQLGGDDLE